MKIQVPTVHNSAKKGDIAKTVIMFGDPLRAKYVAENYLENVVCYNKVRNMFGFTGCYKGKKISLQGSGMGIPSMGIYSMELFLGYDVDNIMRVGTCGILANDNASDISNSVKVRDIIVASSVETDSNYLNSFSLNKNIIPVCSTRILNKLDEIANKNVIEITKGKIFTSDIFYKDVSKLIELSQKDILGVEMETLALYANASITNKNALAMYMVSDNPITGESIDSKEREQGMDKVIKIALDTVVELEN